MGRLDHVHIRVPDRAEAARWYAEYLGFEPVDAYDFWATGFEGGPLQISADGGETMLALFEASEGHPMVPQQTGIAFSVDADTFISFARSLPSGIDSPRGDRLILTDLVDFDMCWAFDLVDPWGNQYELMQWRSSATGRASYMRYTRAPRRRSRRRSTWKYRTQFATRCSISLRS
jgi:catechol 2,3-dioxygenase-like lactoylglutathione lyase family enzyme